LLEGIKRRLGALAGRKIAVLGLAFKADTDDERDSLAHKLIRLLERELADVVAHDPHVQSVNATFDETIADAEALVVATNHAEFTRPDVLRVIRDSSASECLIVDPWNAFGAGQVFAYAAELAALVAS